MRRNQIAIAITVIVSLGLSAVAASASTTSVTSRGKYGQSLTASKARNLGSGEKVTVAGSNYDEKIGIYVAFCEVPEVGKKPGNCYGGINFDGKRPGSVWISSNVPWYDGPAAKIAKPYGKKGSFKVTVTVTQSFGGIDCKIQRCAILTRADHNNSKNRKADVFIPVTFK